MQLRLIPPGEYDLGAGDKDSDARPEEKPRHRVVIRNPFYLGATEVTRSQYQAVMNQGGKFDPKPILDHPAVAVSWHEAMRFCKLLSELEEEKKAGRVYRLPAEVEWEYACRAGSQTPLYFGDIGKIAEHAWFADNGGGFTNPVGKLKPNPWGLHDMLGNVEEWCADTFQGYKAGKIEHDPSIPLPFGTGTNKVARSGSYLTPAKRMTATARTQINPMFATPSLGLRVVLISNRISNSPGR
ncbi:MAG: formylglycine-generating enzyme family protein [Planctomycetes bacterium]|nr:formylglycine-generating enzyme family protein [Planctomycetota bacterium]